MAIEEDEEQDTPLDLCVAELVAALEILSFYGVLECAPNVDGTLTYWVSSGGSRLIGPVRVSS